jgi:hypothetical protein
VEEDCRVRYEMSAAGQPSGHQPIASPYDAQIAASNNPDASCATPELDAPHRVPESDRGSRACAASAAGWLDDWPGDSRDPNSSAGAVGSDGRA